MEKSLEQLKHIERISRQTRRHRIFLNQVYDQKLRQDLNHLTDEYQQVFTRSKAQRKLELQRKQILDLTIQQIADENRRPSLNTTQVEQRTIQKLPPINDNRPSSAIKMPTPESSCSLFSHQCQLYPCQPVYHYSSFIKKEHDQTIRQRNSSAKHSDTNSHLQNFFTKRQEQKSSQDNRSPFAITLRNRYHAAHRHAYIQRTKERLDEQSRLLHEKLTDKKNFHHLQELNQAIHRHLENSAKFCT